MEAETIDQKNGNVLEVARLQASYSGVPALRDVSLSVPRGATVGIVGESGSGKSTLAKAIIGLMGPYGSIDAGSIRFQGTELVGAPASRMRRIRGEGIAFIFQNPGASFSPIRKIGKQYFEAMGQHAGYDQSMARRKILDVFDRLELARGEDLLGCYPFELSGGMNQRVSIAFAIAMNPALVIADEPTSALDVTVQAQVVKELMDMQDNFDTAMLVISHNIGLVGYMADQVGVMQKGRVVEFGEARDVLERSKEPYTQSLIAAVPGFRNATAGGKR